MHFFASAVDVMYALLLASSALPNTLAATVSLPSYPLAVKNPYLSTWVPGDLAKNAATAQPQFWTGQDLTWPVLARVNGKVYSLFGDVGEASGATPATTTSISYTSSHTYFHLTAGSANFVLDYFSPVLPGPQDYQRQSLPYSYLTVSATSSGRESDVQVLSAIDQTWTAQQGSSNLNFTSSGNTGFFWFYNPAQIPFTEFGDMATYGSVIFATTTSSPGSGGRGGFNGGVTHGCDDASNVYQTFSKAGAVGEFPQGGWPFGRPWGAGRWPGSPISKACSGTDLAALSKDLGRVGSKAASVTFAVGFDRVQAINYLNQTQTGYYRSRWPTVPEAVEFVLNENYQPALSSSLSLDSQVRQRAQSVSSAYGSEYADILEASVRQTFGAIDLTIPEDDLTASPSAFLKEISSDGNVNTVDLIFQTWPIFVSLNPEYIKLLFKPILSYLSTGRWPEPFVIHDMGTHYPNATGHDDGVEENMPLFETSTLYILLLVYQKYSGDTSFAQEFMPILDFYAQYLPPNGLHPATQLSSVDAIQAKPNQTALAIQSAIGMKAASIITGNDTYSTIASSFARTIYEEGLGLDGPSPGQSTHFTYQYGNDTTWNVVFAAYSDVLLDLNTFPASAWAMQSSWYEKMLQPGGLPYAGPNTDPGYLGQGFINWGITDWNIEFAAVASPTLQEEIVKTTWQFMTNGLNVIPFGTKYIVEGNGVGQWLANKARPTVGTHFAILALRQGHWYSG